MRNRKRAAAVFALLALLTGGAVFAEQNARQETEKANARPRITVRAQPSVAIAPARIVLTAELVGGADDFEEYYCPTIEWDWGDDTRSETASDCDPYEPGKSEIRRRFTVQHIFRQPGSQKVFFRLKRHSKEVAAASVLIQVRPGAGPFAP